MPRGCPTMESLDIALAPQAQTSLNKDERKAGLEFITQFPPLSVLYKNSSNSISLKINVN